ncbi:hypothetical protein FACS1894187_25070 [Synergistales bacterium]|nr:hypothetical protein FACS1894187_25070 [Synergistales bacterium]
MQYSVVTSKLIKDFDNRWNNPFASCANYMNVVVSIRENIFEPRKGRVFCISFNNYNTSTKKELVNIWIANIQEFQIFFIILR